MIVKPEPHYILSNSIFDQVALEEKNFGELKEKSSSERNRSWKLNVNIILLLFKICKFTDYFEKRLTSMGAIIFIFEEFGTHTSSKTNMMQSPILNQPRKLIVLDAMYIRGLNKRSLFVVLANYKWQRQWNCQ